MPWEIKALTLTVSGDADARNVINWDGLRILRSPSIPIFHNPDQQEGKQGRLNPARSPSTTRPGKTSTGD
jgi:hypothetical protein